MEERPARPGERCTCGRQARVVFLTEQCGPTGWCGLSDGGRRGACWFRGARGGHDGRRCPAYRLRPEPIGDAAQTGAAPEGPVQ